MLSRRFFVAGCALLWLVLGLAHAAKNIYSTEITPAIDLSKFAFYEDRFTNDGTPSPMKLFWSIENQTTLHGVITLQPTIVSPGQPVTNAWVGFGLGESMLTADLFLVWANSSGPVILVEATSGGQYGPVVKLNPGVMTVLSSSQANNTLMLEFTRPLLPSDPHRMAITGSTQQPTIWAYNLQPDSNSPGGWMFTHGINRGSVDINFMTGDANVVPYGLPRTSKFIHGASMTFGYMIIYPAGAFIGRYCRSIDSWLQYHVLCQSISTVISVAVAIYLATSFTFPWWTLTHRHTILGITLITLVTFQGFTGLLHRLSMTNERLASFKKPLQVYHRYSGWAIILSATVQVGFGIQILWPLEVASSGHGQLALFYLPWAIYGLIIVFWIVLFTGAEIIYRTKFVNRDKKLSKSAPATAESSQDIKNPLLFSNNVTDGSEYPEWTWQEIDQRVQRGELLVVADGTYIYDASKWLSSHPGGQLVLQSVAGTDITNDYFHEAGFDTETFIANNAIVDRAMSNITRSLPSELRRDFVQNPALQSSIMRERIISYRPSVMSVSHMQMLTEAEYHSVFRARRPHVHTRLAIQKLSSMLVATVKNSDYEVSNRDLAQDPYEYRRYAVVSNLCETTLTTGEPVFRMKFSQLYPLYSRFREAEPFLPGQTVEIQIRIDGRPQTCSFAPVNGNTSVFEILVPSGESKFLKVLTSQIAGERQVKIRGPFGAPLVSPRAPINALGGYCFDSMIMVCENKEFSLALQLLSYLFLPKYVNLMVNTPYVAQNYDQLTIQPGDLILVHEHYYDGWARGALVSTGQIGYFPLGVTNPYCGNIVRLIILHDANNANDVYGANILEGAQCAYPGNISVIHRFESDRPPMSAQQLDVIAPGQKIWGKPRGSIIRSVLDNPTNGFSRAGIPPSDEYHSQRIFVCGGPELDRLVRVTAATPEVGIPQTDILTVVSR
ncbi:uncharacterized protein BJ171DRAFT_489558 [Polychytrium aggregatum]|uniref:uncharacterized protein n=1 Tax=Polychytrium aggregatum TaxID=110093 RepID=UPI0022FDF89A|nr:uncharacterized protein BJ171DRAFT_489558 [Polychytrium aggregatum]KAI9208634.1 hypothetical protein BJ171DRAFT_489558 [Polychytrium aggregatum]